MSKIGRFGEFGGQYIPETVMTAVHELEKAYDKYKDDPEFNKELQELYHNYAGRPSMLYYAEKMTKDLGGAKIYIKREDLNHTGSHKKQACGMEKSRSRSFVGNGRCYHISMACKPDRAKPAFKSFRYFPYSNGSERTIFQE